MPLEPGQIVELAIERIIPGGAGLAHAEGCTVFVPLTAPGDRIRASVTRRRGKTANAELVDVIEPGPGRVLPPCPYFGTCGGCDFQHLSYAEQLRTKEELVRDSLRRIAGLPIAPVVVIGSPDEWAYRRRARWQHDSANGATGYFGRATHAVIDIAACPVLRPALDILRGDLRTTLRTRQRGSELEWDAAEGDAGVAIHPSVEGLPGRDLHVSVRGENYTFAADCFFQTNFALLETLIETVIGGERPVLEGGGVAIDLYCGVGLFTLPLGRTFSRVFGVEVSFRSVRYAKKNAQLAGLDNVSFVAQPTGTWVTQRGRNLHAIDLAVVDPPRSGIDAETRAGLIRMKPRRIAYVSCDPATFSRDLAILMNAGYELDGPVTVFDMFPQTHHVELVGKLQRTEPAVDLLAAEASVSAATPG